MQTALALLEYETRCHPAGAVTSVMDARAYVVPGSIEGKEKRIDESLQANNNIESECEIYRKMENKTALVNPRGEFLFDVVRASFVAECSVLSLYNSDLLHLHLLYMRTCLENYSYAGFPRFPQVFIMHVSSCIKSIIVKDISACKHCILYKNKSLSF